jgi:glycosyltransferase involved in cell wall biosynthesis
MPSVLVLSFSDLARDPRVSRQIDWLAGEFSVTAAGTGPPGRDDVRFIRVRLTLGGKVAKGVRGLRLLTRRHERVYWDTFGSAFAALERERPEFLIANDLDALPLMIRLGEIAKAPVLFDAHEYAPREFDDSWRWRLLRAPYAIELTKKYVPMAAAVTTVGMAIADEFAELTGVRPDVITNAPSYHPELSPRPVAPDGPIRLIHHGGAIASRKIENMLEIAPMLEARFEFNFMLVENEPAYAAKLKAMAANLANVHFRPPVPMPELPAHLNLYDVGVYLLEPTNFNNRNALPNKLFEFLQGRLAIAIGPTPEMARIVKATEAGVVAEDFQPESLAKVINALTADEVNRYKQAAHAAAREYSAETNREKFLAICRRILGA